MKSYDKIFAAVMAVIILIFIGANVGLRSLENGNAGRPYRVEANRISLAIEQNGLDYVDLSEYSYVKQIEKYNGEEAFFSCESDYLIREIDGALYRFDYSRDSESISRSYLYAVNGILAVMSLMIIVVLVFLRRKILLPFERLADVPYELAKGNLTSPIKESKSRFFGKFIWGVDLLRENMEQQKQRELALQKSKKTLLLSLSHDIKTPLSAIKLYAKALAKGLYTDMAKQQRIAEHINEKADEIEDFVSQIISASREDFLNFEVKEEEFYLSELVNNVAGYYREKLALIKTDFFVEKYSDCLLKGDLDRSTEVLQNIMENAIKYGDGRSIILSVYEEEGCKLIAIKNSGCKLPEAELPHIFESFWRGSNAGNSKGSGLGLYICRQLMRKMGGEVFAKVQEDAMIVTAVFGKAM